MSRLLLLDGHSLAYRAFFALPAENFSTSTGQHTNAVYGFTAMLINVLRDEDPTHVGVAFDISRQTFRSEQYAEYKAGRSETPSAFKGQIPLLKEVLDALHIRHVELEGYEADDIIATLTTQGRAAGMEVLICSGDRDTLQLVAEGTTVLYPRKGVSDLARMTPSAVTEKYGVGPERYSDLAALVGESSDNLPGVPGVGPKTAAKWIGAYGDLEGSSPMSGRSAARRASRCATTSTTCCATGGSTACSPTPRSGSTSASLGARPGTGRRCTPSSTASSSGCCATASSRPSTPRRPR